MKNKKATKKSASQKLRRYSRQHPRKTIFLLLAALLLGVVVVTATNNYIQTRAEHTKFLQAKADLDTLYREIVAKVGKPDAHKATQSCHYSSAKFSKGFLSCSVDNFFFFHRDEVADRIDLADKINSVLSTSNLTNAFESRNLQYAPKIELAGASFNFSTMRQCGSQYISIDKDTDIYGYRGFLGEGETGISGMLYCTSYSKAEYFPVRN